MISLLGLIILASPFVVFFLFMIFAAKEEVDNVLEITLGKKDENVES